MLLLEEAGIAPPSGASDAYAILPTPQAQLPAMVAIEALRAAGVSVVMHAGGGSMKSQFKKADASGARFALIFGADELARGAVTVKSLRDGSGAQVERPLEDVAAWAPTLQSRA